MSIEVWLERRVQSVVSHTKIWMAVHGHVEPAQTDCAIRQFFPGWHIVRTAVYCGAGFSTKID